MGVFVIIVGVFVIIVGDFPIEGGMLIGAQIIMFQIDNLTLFLTSEGYRA